MPTQSHSAMTQAEPLQTSASAQTKASTQAVSAPERLEPNSLQTDGAFPAPSSLSGSHGASCLPDSPDSPNSSGGPCSSDSPSLGGTVAHVSAPATSSDSSSVAPPQSRSPLFQGVVKGGILFATLIVVGGLLRYADASGLFDASFLNAYVKDKGALGVCIFLGLGIVFSAIGLPRQLMSVAAGYAFGVVAGTLIMGVALVGGGLLSFYYMRFLARDVLRRRFEAKIAVIEHFWLQKTFLLTLCWRLLPLGNNTLTNMLAGTSKVRAVPFFCGSFIGYIPQNLIFALLGSGIGFDDTQKFLYSALLFFVSVGLGVFVYRSLRKQGEELVLITKSNTH